MCAAFAAAFFDVAVDIRKGFAHLRQARGRSCRTKAIRCFNLALPTASTRSATWLTSCTRSRATGLRPTTAHLWNDPVWIEWPRGRHRGLKTPSGRRWPRPTILSLGRKISRRAFHDAAALGSIRRITRIPARLTFFSMSWRMILSWPHVRFGKDVDCPPRRGRTRECFSIQRRSKSEAPTARPP